MSDEEFTGACIVLIPADSDPVSAASSQPAHITMAWFGDHSEMAGDKDAIRDAAAAYAAEADGPITAAVKNRGTLGDEDADVVFLEGDGLVAYREGLVALGPVKYAMDDVEQYPQWTPHVTLGYPDEPAKADYDEDTVTFDRLGLWLGEDHQDFALGGEDDDMADDEDIPDEEMAEGLEALGQDPVQWYGVLAPTGVESGDGRGFDPDVITHRKLPLPLKWQKEDNPGHFTSVVVANIEGQREVNGLIYGHGTFAQTEEAAEVIELRAANMLRGVSVDLDKATFEFRTASGKVLTAGDEIPDDSDPVTQWATSGRTSAATIVPIPSFEEAFFNLGAPPADWPSLALAQAEEAEGEEEVVASNECETCPGGVVASIDENGHRLLLVMNGMVAAGTWGGAREGDFCVHADCGDPATVEVELESHISGMFCDAHASTALDDWEKETGNEELASAAREALEALVAAPGTHDGPGWVTHPKATERIRRYWVRGKGAAKIRWGMPGDFNRCRKQLAKYIKNPAWLAGACANMHKEAILLWPGQEDGKHEAETIAASAAPAWFMEPALTAAAPVHPREWFENPELVAPTPLTVTSDGRVYGHIATWGVCHIGRSDQCVQAPPSNTDYAYFHVGAVETSNGPVAVGHITMKTGHADLSLSANAASAHYDNTATVAADVHAGDDAHGIWIAGAVRPGLSDEDVYALRASAISGDWRRIGAGMELVAALAVNTPGFPIPRIGLAASGEEETALVAAAIVPRDPAHHFAGSTNTFDVEGWTEQIAAKVTGEIKRKSKLDAARAKVKPINDERRQAILAAASEE